MQEEPTAEMMEEVERRINEVIDRHLPVTIEFVPKAEAGKIVDLSKLPEDASETLRIVRIGDYDTCACIGAHVNNTSEIGHFKMLTYDYTDGRLRLAFQITTRTINNENMPIRKMCRSTGVSYSSAHFTNWHIIYLTVLLSS